MSKINFIIILLFIPIFLSAQENRDTTMFSKEPTSEYKKRVLESIEIDILSSYYTQDGDHAAVSGGIGTESLQDATGTIIISIPINDDDVLVIDAGVSAYTSASSSNINPFDRRGTEASPFVASSGESQSDVWSSITASYSHSSDDRNRITSGYASLSSEYDYTSMGFGGSYAHLFNEKNTELSIKASVFLDTWSLLYPAELGAFGLQSNNDDDEDDFNINNYTISGNPNYAPNVIPLSTNKRNSYSLGLGFSRILSEKLQGSMVMDVVRQNGQLSTPFQRVYFADKENAYIENFHLADDIERLPSDRIKVALGGRLNYYVNEFLSVRSFYRYYQDDWDLSSHTFSVELPIKILEGQFTFYPSYRYYQQSGVKYFAPYNEHQSSSAFYTSDYDLSPYSAHQLGFGVGYRNIFGTKKLWKFALKSLDLKYYRYNRDIQFNSHLVTFGVKFKFN